MKASSELRTRTDTEFRVDVGQVELDGLDAHEQLRGDLAVTQPVAHQPSYGQLLRGKAGRIQSPSIGGSEAAGDQLAFAPFEIRPRLKAG